MKLFEISHELHNAIENCEDEKLNDLLSIFNDKSNDILRYAFDNGIQGRVFVSFVVERDGSISNVKAMRGIGGGCDEEAVRVIQSMPKWNPARQRGETVRCSYTIPIIFKMQ